MNALRLMAVLLVFGFVADTRGNEQKADGNKEKLIGTWEVVKADEPPPPVGTVIEFAKDGKIKVTHKLDGKDVTIEGSYTVEGDTISVVLKVGDAEDKHKITIKKIDANEIMTENDKGKAVDFKRKR